MIQHPGYDFIRRMGRILNSGQTRCLALTGNIQDWFFLEAENEYLPLIDLLRKSWSLPDRILITYELNGPIRFQSAADQELVKTAFIAWRLGQNQEKAAMQRLLNPSKKNAEAEIVALSFDTTLQDTIGKPTLALEFLRQLCLCSRTSIEGQELLPKDLLIFIEGADLILPEGSLLQLNEADRHRVAVLQDWFTDPGFLKASDSVILFTESMSLLHHRIARLPMLLEVAVPSPDLHLRSHYIHWFQLSSPSTQTLFGDLDEQEVARFSGGLNVHALRQLLVQARHENRVLDLADLVFKVESYIQAQLGEDIVEFKKPTHKMKDLVGFKNLKAFIQDELIPRFQTSGAGSLSGCAVSGPIGGGKTFIFEAVASELDMVVLVLKNIRSQWFGQTDVILERLKRVLESLHKVLIFIDEADTQFGDLGPESHSTEKRLTGKIQSMMSDPLLKGRVLWLLMTARIHKLSPDIRRPGRVGDMIVPVLDPSGEDQEEFIRFALKPVLTDISKDLMQELKALTESYSSAAYSTLKSELQAKAKGAHLNEAEILSVVEDLLTPAIGSTRRYQTLQALVNCTRRKLLPDPAGFTLELRESWEKEIRQLEARGMN